MKNGNVVVSILRIQRVNVFLRTTKMSITRPLILWTKLILYLQTPVISYYKLSLYRAGQRIFLRGRLGRRVVEQGSPAIAWSSFDSLSSVSEWWSSFWAASFWTWADSSLQTSCTASSDQLTGWGVWPECWRGDSSFPSDCSSSVSYTHLTLPTIYSV